MSRQHALHDTPPEDGLGRVAMWLIGGVGLVVLVFLVTVTVLRLFSRFML